jgi:hypothetical protein
MEGVGDPLVDSLVETMDVEVEQQGAIVVEQQGAMEVEQQGAMVVEQQGAMVDAEEVYGTVEQKITAWWRRAKLMRKNSRRISRSFIHPSKGFSKKLIVYLRVKTRFWQGVSTSATLTWRCYPLLCCHLPVRDAYSLLCAKGVVCAVRHQSFVVSLVVYRCQMTCFLARCAEVLLSMMIFGARTVQLRLGLVKMVYALIVVATPLPLLKIKVSLCLIPR